jgi:proteic killer suppression protein
VIRNIRHKGLKQLFETGTSAKVAPHLHARCLRRLDRIAAAVRLENLNVPGFDFHKLRAKPVRYSIHVNGPWCITFGWDERSAEAIDVDLEQYH